MVFDTLSGQDSTYAASPQMVAGHVIENDGRLWNLTLRDGLKWHDGEKVLARDCVASINRWGKRDAFGQALLAATDELSAPDDKTIRFRLKKPFPLLPDALGKSPSLMPAMMPERLAKTDAFTQIPEVIGSGPYRFIAKDRIPGARAAYERFAGYVPRSPAASPTGPPGRRSRISIASNGRRSATPPPPPPHCKAASRIGGTMRRPICCRCCGRRRT